MSFRFGWKQQTKLTNYSSLSLFASLDTQDPLQGGIIVEWNKFRQEIPVCSTQGGLSKSSLDQVSLLEFVRLGLIRLGQIRSAGLGHVSEHHLGWEKALPIEWGSVSMCISYDLDIVN